MRVDVGPLGGNLLEVAVVASKENVPPLAYYYFSLIFMFSSLNCPLSSLLRQLCHPSHTKFSFSVWFQCEDGPAGEHHDLCLTSKLLCSKCGNDTGDIIR